MADKVLVLVTTREWFIGKDGQLYRAVWGPVEVSAVTTEKEDSYYTIGEDDQKMYIEKSQIITIQACKTEPAGTSVLKLI